MGGWASRLQAGPGATDPQGRPEDEQDEEALVEEEPEVEVEEEGDVGMENQQNFVAVQKKKKIEESTSAGTKRKARG